MTTSKGQLVLIKNEQLPRKIN